MQKTGRRKERVIKRLRDAILRTENKRWNPSTGRTTDHAGATITYVSRRYVGRAVPDEIAQLLSDVSPDVRSICRSLRALVKEVMPQAVEFVYHGAVSYSLSESPFDRICCIAPYGTYANLGFSFGTRLSDPRGLLVGEGQRMRHVKVRSAVAARDRALADLLRAAWADAPHSIGRLHTRARKGKS